MITLRITNPRCNRAFLLIAIMVAIVSFCSSTGGESRIDSSPAGQDNDLPWAIDCVYVGRFEGKRLTVYPDGTYRIYILMDDVENSPSFWAKTSGGALPPGSVGKFIALINRYLIGEDKCFIHANHTEPGRGTYLVTHPTTHAIQFSHNLTIGSVTVKSLDSILHWDETLDARADDSNRHPRFRDAYIFAQVWNEIGRRCEWETIGLEVKESDSQGKGNQSGELAPTDGD